MELRVCSESKLRCHMAVGWTHGVQERSPRGGTNHSWNSTEKNEKRQALWPILSSRNIRDFPPHETRVFRTHKGHTRQSTRNSQRHPLQGHITTSWACF